MHQTKMMRMNWRASEPAKVREREREKKRHEQYKLTRRIHLTDATTAQPTGSKHVSRSLRPNTPSICQYDFATKEINIHTIVCRGRKRKREKLYCRQVFAWIFFCICFCLRFHRFVLVRPWNLFRFYIKNTHIAHTVHGIESSWVDFMWKTKVSLFRQVT